MSFVCTTSMEHKPISGLSPSMPIIYPKRRSSIDPPLSSYCDGSWRAGGIVSPGSSSSSSKACLDLQGGAGSWRRSSTRMAIVVPLRDDANRIRTSFWQRSIERRWAVVMISLELELERLYLHSQHPCAVAAGRGS